MQPVRSLLPRPARTVPDSLVWDAIAFSVAGRRTVAPIYSKFDRWSVPDR